jgi:lysophospholipase L1-like esterase
VVYRARIRRLGKSLAALLAALSVPAAVPAAGRADDAPAAPGPVVVVGDSLAVGLRPYLRRMLVGHPLTWDVRSGRTTPQGLPLLRAAIRAVPHPQAVVISLGTNDGTDPRRFADRIRRALDAIPADACVIWPDIYRPPRKGAFRQLNRVLRAWTRRDGRVVVLPWDRAVADHRVRLPDGLHPDAAGFRLRARMIANAVDRGCVPAIAA